MNETSDLKQTFWFQSKRVCTRQKDATAFRRRQTEKVRLDLRQRIVKPCLRLKKIGFYGGEFRCFEFEGKLVVERAELAGAVRATRSRFQDE